MKRDMQEYVTTGGRGRRPLMAVLCLFMSAVVSFLRPPATIRGSSGLSRLSPSGVPRGTRPLVICMAFPSQGQRPTGAWSLRPRVSSSRNLGVSQPRISPQSFHRRVPDPAAMPGPGLAIGLRLNSVVRAVLRAWQPSPHRVSGSREPVTLSPGSSRAGPAVCRTSGLRRRPPGRAPALLVPPQQTGQLASPSEAASCGRRMAGGVPCDPSGCRSRQRPAAPGRVTRYAASGRAPTRITEPRCGNTSEAKSRRGNTGGTIVQHEVQPFTSAVFHC